MARVTFARAYFGVVQGTKFAIDAGATLDLADDHVAAIDADQPGTFAVDEPEPVAEPNAEARAVEAPPKDRMVRKANKRGGAP